MPRFTLTPDATFLAWRKDILLVAPLYSGVVQVFNTNNTISNNSNNNSNSNSNYEEMASLVGSFRKIDAVAVYENVVATAETRTVK